MKSIIFIILTIIIKAANSQELDTIPPIVEMKNVKIFDSTTNSIIYNVENDSLKKEMNLFCLNNQSKVHFYYHGQVTTKPDQVKYMTKLLGYEKNWSQVSADDNVEYQNLKAGNYIFTILACNASGLWNIEIYTYKFKIDINR